MKSPVRATSPWSIISVENEVARQGHLTLGDYFWGRSSGPSPSLQEMKQFGKMRKICDYSRGRSSACPRATRLFLGKDKEEVTVRSNPLTTRLCLGEVQWSLPLSTFPGIPTCSDVTQLTNNLPSPHFEYKMINLPGDTHMFWGRFSGPSPSRIK